MKILVIDNYDSFVFNLVQYIGELGCKPLVYRNNSISINEIKTINPKGIVISPGPGHPKNKPILGVCLGHQAIVHAYGGKIIQAERIMHGKTSKIKHTEKGIFKGAGNPLEVMRYHSLIADPNTFPHQKLKITALTTDKKEIFAVEHKKYPVSVGTDDGKIIVKNFLEILWW